MGRGSVLVAVAILTAVTTLFLLTDTERPEVVVPHGRLIGLQENNINIFRGVAYALPPIESQRWAPPVPVPPSNHRLEASEFASACPQGDGNTRWYEDVAASFGHAAEAVFQLKNISEDCLYLNIWAPSNATNLPVMVWIHGGSNVNGYAHEPNYLGHNLARLGVIVVSVNYRLGPLGFMAHPLFSPEAPLLSGQYGVLDLMAALTWVKTNINKFGGDPERVTLFGESAGGANIVALMHAPQAIGLFKRAIIQSGALGPRDMNVKDKALDYGARFLSDLSSEQTLDAFRELEWPDLEAHRQIYAEDYYHGPIIDGEFLLPDMVNPVPVLIGSNLDEWRMYLDEDVIAETKQALSKYYTAALDPSWLAAQYPDPIIRADRLISAAEFLCPSSTLAERVRDKGHASYVYLFSRVRPKADALGAYHGTEIPYIFATHDAWLPTDEVDLEITQAMQASWVAFARGEEPWPSYSIERLFMQFDDTITIQTGHGAPLCRYLQTAKP